MKFSSGDFEWNFMTADFLYAATSRRAAKAEFSRGIKDALPMVLGVLPYALVLGAQASQKGLNALEVALMTGLNFAGGSEFAAIQLWASPPPLLLIVAITFLINSRHFLMGAALTSFLQHIPKRKALPALFFLCDEAWAISYADAKKRESAGRQPAFSLAHYMGAGTLIYGVWVGFTTVGAWIGPRFGNVEVYGFDMAFPAVFLVLLSGMWKGVRSARPWLVSLLVAALTYLFVPGAWYVLSGALSGLAVAYYWRPLK
jgi:4-azaleucine resistance transporter AzlC